MTGMIDHFSFPNATQPIYSRLEPMLTMIRFFFSSPNSI